MRPWTPVVIFVLAKGGVDELADLGLFAGVEAFRHIGHRDGDVDVIGDDQRARHMHALAVWAVGAGLARGGLLMGHLAGAAVEGGVGLAVDRERSAQRGDG